MSASSQNPPSPYPFVRTVASGMVATALPRPIVAEEVTPRPTTLQTIAVPTPNAPLQPVDLPKLLRSLEDSYIQAALTQTKGNRKAAADLLGLQRTTLVEKLRRRKRASETTETQTEAQSTDAGQTSNVG